MQWVGWLVVGFVCFWMAIIALVVLRTGLVMLMLTWAGLKQWGEYRAEDPEEVESRSLLPERERGQG